MGCWIGRIIIVRNEGTVIFGNAEMIGGREDDSEEDSSEEDTGQPATEDPGEGVSEGTSSASSSSSSSSAAAAAKSVGSAGRGRRRPGGRKTRPRGSSRR